MKKFGDRKDGKLLRSQDAMHLILNNLLPKRTQCETFITKMIDLTEVIEYLSKINDKGFEHKISMFELIAAVLAKTTVLRPRLNYFIANKKTYERNYHAVSFIVKKKFEDNSEESMANIRFEKEDDLSKFHEKVSSKIYILKKDEFDEGNKDMELVNKIPNFLLKVVFPIVRFLDKHGKLPQSIMDDDPNYSSVFLTNLGSIGLDAGYHHLSEWGTNSFFCIVGLIKKRPFYKDDGSFEMKDSVELGIVADERIADGYYFAKSIRLAEYLFQHPEELEKPFLETVNYE